MNHRPAPSRLGRAVAAMLTLGLLSGCHAPMSVFSEAGPEARALGRLGWLLIVAAAVVFIAVTSFMVAAIQRRRAEPVAVDLTPRGMAIPIVAGAMIPATILLVLFVISVLAQRGYPAESAAPAARFTIIGHQWWWEVAAEDGRGNLVGRTANELHVPVGRVVEIRLLSADVIHSFWIPELHGKIDMIPGDTNRIRLLAMRPGIYRGQCAEYCGLQHAHMAFTVVAEAPAAYLRWEAAQRDGAAVPVDSARRLGDSIVTRGPCAACHTIRGTAAHGTVGPDLTHVGSRVTIAAGTLPNNAATMEAWINDAQVFKPGVQMPPLPEFTGAQLRAMTAYLEGLH
ncbi:MAG: cytochrome c oxidase subunit II [Gemmatimonadales bacterium]